MGSDSYEDLWYEDIKAQLHPWQSEFLDAVEWLILDQNESTRADGRTHLLAVVFIRLAMLHPREWVYPYDHFSHSNPRMSQMRIQSNIDSILIATGVKHRCSFKAGAFRYDGPSSP